MVRSRQLPSGRGHQADRPTDIPAAGWRDILGRVVGQIGDDHVSVVSAGVAFFGLLALFPAIGAVVSVAGYLLDPEDVRAQISTVTAMLPEGAAAVFEDQLAQAAGTSQTATGLGAVFGFLLALYGAMRGVRTLMEGMNIAYDEDEDRGFVALNLAALGLTLVLILGVLAALAALIVLPLVTRALGLPEGVQTLIALAKWPVLAAAAALGLAVIYRWGPSRADPRWRWISPGAVAATALWLLGTVAFSVYVANFADYKATYGTIGGVIILLTWLWLSAFIVLLGAELNAEMERQTLHDTTTGPRREMGRRGAVVADRPPGAGGR
jgi:membrane protein